jgi:hypothetical protein
MTKHYTFTVAVPEGTDPGEFNFVRALLDAVEPGAGGHCLGITYGSGDWTNYSHHRLGVDLRSMFVERP